jgi:hypothetical protein
MLTYLGATCAAAQLGGAPALTPSAAAATRARARTSLAPATRFPGDPGTGRVYYGATVPYYQDLAAWETWLGRPLASHRHYHDASEIAELVSTVTDDLDNTRMSHASIKPAGTWAEVARGDQDVWLEDLLRQVGALNAPVFLTINHEPEDDAGTTGMWPGQWVSMQERAIKKAAVLAPKATITPVLMQWTFDPASGRNPSQWQVPSAKVFGFDVYNSWSPTNGKKWTSFGTKVDRIKPWTGGRPLVVGEYGCREDPANPERAVQWMRDAFAYARANQIVCMSYFNSRQNSPEGSWELDGRRADVFRELLADPAVARP